ncbi:MAG: hypothetical protein ACPL7G_11120 [Chloroflexia bacterium]
MPLCAQSGTEGLDVEVMAARLEEIGWAGPAYLLLQSLRPLSFLGGQGLLFLQPFLPFARARSVVGRLAELLSDRSRLEALLAALETHLRSQERTSQEGDR